MRIALLGGNSYQYAFKPSYAQANGKGYITGNQLLGQTDAEIRQGAIDSIAWLESQGKPVSAELRAIAAGKDPANTASGSGSNPVFGFIENLLDAGQSIVSDITGAKKPPTNGNGVATKTDNTALVVTAAVAGVALLAVAMSKKPRRR